MVVLVTFAAKTLPRYTLTYFVVLIDTNDGKHLACLGFLYFALKYRLLCLFGARIKSGKYGHQVNSDTHLQTV